MGHWKMLSFILVCALSVVAFAWLITLSFHRVGGPVPTRVMAGKKVWQREGCVECHAIFGNGGYNGSDLTDITKRKSPDHILDYLTDPPTLFPHSRRRHTQVSFNDARAIIDFLTYISNVNSKDWPPKPATKP